MAALHRNYKVVYSNINLKQNVKFITARAYYEATRKALQPLMKLNYAVMRTQSSRNGRVITVYLVPVKVSSYPFDNIKKDDYRIVVVELIHLHATTKRKLAPSTANSL